VLSCGRCPPVSGRAGRWRWCLPWASKRHRAPFRGLRTIAPKSLERFKQRIREIARRAKGVSIKTTMEELARYMRGWAAANCILRRIAPGCHVSCSFLALVLKKESVSRTSAATAPSLDFSNYPTLGRARAPVSAVFVAAEHGCGRI
jgi:hypothetical protein